MDIKSAKTQIKKLYLLDGLGSMMIADASWVALLYARGFSTVEIGFLESIFHVASMTFEIPSGAIADVFGRKLTLCASRIMSLIFTIAMILSNSFVLIGVAMIANALSYNLASGTREALAYDSLKSAEIEDEYNKYASRDMIIYQLSSSVATLLAGFAIAIGYKKAYMIDAIVCVAAILTASTLVEVKTELSSRKNYKVSDRFKEVASESFLFIKTNKKARLLILYNATISAIAVLIFFFLQAKLPDMGLGTFWLGPALFIMGLGSVIGAKLADIFSEMKYNKIAIGSLIGVLAALFTVYLNNPCAVIVGGFIGLLFESFLSVRTDVKLNNMIPSNQRATLISINSFAYSVVMIVLSPVFGWMFSA